MTITNRLSEDICRIRIPLPVNLLPYTNAYVLCSQDRNLIIDTGMNTPLCENAMRQSLADIDVDLDRTDIFVTHFHRDHMGLARVLVKEGANVFMSKIDFQEMEGLKRNNWFLPNIQKFSAMSGFPENDLREAYQFFTEHEKNDRQPEFPITLLNDGDVLTVGDMELQCIMTPGHSKGHMCLYDPSKEILFSGDHLLDKITPTIQGRFDKENPLKDYLSSLEKIYSLKVKKSLPGHGKPFDNTRERITELKHHHFERTENILQILSERDATTYIISSLMSWNIRSTSWEDYEPLQRFLAVGETISHLNYLTMEGRVTPKPINNQITYSLTKSSVSN